MLRVFIATTSSAVVWGSLASGSIHFGLSSLFFGIGLHLLVGRNFTLMHEASDFTDWVVNLREVGMDFHPLISPGFGEATEIVLSLLSRARQSSISR